MTDTNVRPLHPVRHLPPRPSRADRLVYSCITVGLILAVLVSVVLCVIGAVTVLRWVFR